MANAVALFQMVLPLKTQEDLDQAVLTTSSSSGANGLLRILLKTPKNNHVSCCRVEKDAVCTQTGGITACKIYRTV